MSDFKVQVFLITSISAAIEKIGRRLPPSSQARDRVVDAMIEAAEAGQICEADFVRAGLAAIHEIEKPRW
jgi:hypothetical protein